MLSPKHLYKLFVKAGKAWVDDFAPSMGAAISYYTVFSLAPLLIIVIAMAGAVFGREAVQGQIVAQISGLIGQEGASLIQGLVAGASDTDKGLIAGLISLGVLLIGATTVFAELQSALDRIWHVPEAEKPQGIWAILRARLLSFGLILGLVFLLMVSLAVSTGIAALDTWVNGLFPGWEATLHVVNIVVSVGFTTAALRHDLQADAHGTHRLARRMDGRFRHGHPVRSGQVADQPLPGQERSNGIVRRRRFAGGVAGVGVLRGADLLAGCRVHQGVCRRARLAVGREGHDRHCDNGGCGYTARGAPCPAGRGSPCRGRRTDRAAMVRVPLQAAKAALISEVIALVVVSVAGAVLSNRRKGLQKKLRWARRAH